MATTGIQPSGGVGPSQSSNTIANPNLATGCENLWYAPRCNPRLDPFAMNAVIAEMINLVNCGGNAYDCTRLDNLCTAVKDLIKDVLHDCQDRAYPDASGACSVEQLVLTTDATGCKRIARYNSASARVGLISAVNIFGPNSPRVLIPANPGNPATFYNNGELAAAQSSNTIDETKLTPNRVATGNFTLACAGQIELVISNNDVQFDPPANGGNGVTSQLVPRIDGNFILTGGGVLTAAFTSFTNFVSQQSNVSILVNLAAGPHTIDVYVIAEGSGRPPAQVERQTFNGIASHQIIAQIPIQ